jgi:hypothetical protein
MRRINGYYLVLRCNVQCFSRKMAHNFQQFFLSVSNFTSKMTDGIFSVQFEFLVPAALVFYALIKGELIRK